MTYDQLITDSNVEVYELDMCIKGLYADGIIGISRHIKTTVEKLCILAEELGHHYTTQGNILDLKILENKEQEFKARAWAYETLMPIELILATCLSGGSRGHCFASENGITTEFLIDAIVYYAIKHKVFKCNIEIFEALGICN